MYLQHFGLAHPPLGKQLTEPWDDGALAHLKQRFDWLLQSPGIGLITGEPGVGKTAALRSLTHALTLERWRSEGIGPKFVKLCGRVIYRQVDIEAFEAACLATSTKTANPAAQAGER